MSKTIEILGEKAEYYLSHVCRTIDKKLLYLPAPDTVDRAALLARLARLDEQLANGQYAARQASAEIDILLKAGPLAASYQPIHAAVVELRFEAARAALSRLMALLKNE